jgi:hypothetical protein
MWPLSGAALKRDFLIRRLASRLVKGVVAFVDRLGGASQIQQPLRCFRSWALDPESASGLPRLRLSCAFRLHGLPISEFAICLRCRRGDHGQGTDHKPPPNGQSRRCETSPRTPRERLLRMATSGVATQHAAWNADVNSSIDRIMCVLLSE